MRQEGHGAWGPVRNAARPMPSNRVGTVLGSPPAELHAARVVRDPCVLARGGPCGYPHWGHEVYAASHAVQARFSPPQRSTFPPAVPWHVPCARA